MKANKLIIKIFTLLFFTLKPIFSMEQPKPISEQQLKLQQKLKNAISKIHYKGVRVALIEGASVNIETLSIWNMVSGNTTPLADTLIATDILLETFKKSSFSKLPFIAIASVLFGLSGGSFVLAIKKTDLGKDIPTVSGFIFSLATAITIYNAVMKKVSEKRNEENYENMVKILKLIINQKDFKFDKFSENLSSKMSPELNKIVKSLLAKKQNTLERQ